MATQPRFLIKNTSARESRGIVLFRHCEAIHRIAEAIQTYCHSERSEESKSIPSLRENEHSEFSWQSTKISSLQGVWAVANTTKQSKK